MFCDPATQALPSPATGGAIAAFDMLAGGALQFVAAAAVEVQRAQQQGAAFAYVAARTQHESVAYCVAAAQELRNLPERVAGAVVAAIAQQLTQPSSAAQPLSPEDGGRAFRMSS